MSRQRAGWGFARYMASTKPKVQKQRKSKYEPHQGKAECARRLRQLAKEETA